MWPIRAGRYDRLWPLLLLQGLRADLILLGLIVTDSSANRAVFAVKRAWSAMGGFSLFWVITAIIWWLMEAITPGFLSEYNTRPKRHVH